MNYKATTLALLLTCSAPLMAGPVSCPSILSLQSVGIGLIDFGWPGRWWAFSNKWTEDNHEWQFATVGIDVENEDEVPEQLKKDLAKLTDIMGPSADQNDPNKWSCIYASEQVHSITVAVTPALIDMKSLAPLVAQFKR